MTLSTASPTTPADETIELQIRLSDARSSALASAALIRRLVAALRDAGVLSDTALSDIETGAAAELGRLSGFTEDPLLNIDLRDAAAKVPTIVRETSGALAERPRAHRRW